MMNRLKKRRPSVALRNERTCSIESLEGRRLFAVNFATATVVGNLDGRFTGTGFVGDGDFTARETGDYAIYKFTLPTQAVSVRAKLQTSATGITDESGTLFLYSAPNLANQIGTAYSAGPGLPGQITKTPLAAGTYYAMVDADVPNILNYSLELIADYAGNTTAAARNIGTVGSTLLTYKDFVGTNDTNDYYKFTVAATGDYNFNLSGMTGNANLAVLNSSGVSVASSANTGTTAENLTKNLAAGTYYIRVTPASGINTNYTLKVVKSGWPDGAGNNRSLAKSLGIISGVKQISGAGSSLAQEGITPTDLDDFYKFVVGEAGTIKAQLASLTGNLNVWFENSAGTVLLPKGLNTGTTAESISLSVQPGVYYARVFQGTTGVSSQYKLTLTCPVDAGATIATAMTAPPINSDMVSGWGVFNKNVGPDDTADVYKVSLTAGDKMNIYYEEATNVNLTLYNSSGTVLKSLVNKGPDEFFVFTVPSTGNYFVSISKGSLSSSSFYNVWVEYPVI